ncbi:MAG: hypothetical protein JWR51_3178 [Devosia sp.]|uniref:hypothetical protein n=1 Tax=Devosia sp. TaxID=1871048 RepID=UPI002628D769|nr:hypothetical protein [Devosia sp.]MDB5530075.1 hypothetical protein [Devosia sp.]
MTQPVIEPRRKGRSGTQTMLIPSLEMVSEAIAAVPPGRAGDLGTVRTSLAARYGADACCPVTVQRHLRTIAEQVVAGDGTIPFWRVTDPDRPNSARLAGGVEFIRARQAAER